MIQKNIIKLKFKINRIWVRIKYYFTFSKCENEQEEKRINWIYYKNIEKKYRKFLDKLEYSKNTNKFSNKVWWCWFQGEEQAPDLNKACLNSLKEKLIDRDIIIITEKNYEKYIEVPEYIKEKYKNGIISKTHFSDILRINLLVKYGGTWIDSSVLCTNYDKDMFDKNLFLYQNWKTGDNSIVASSWFITSEINNPILKDTLALLNEYWKKYDYLINYFLLHFFISMAANKYQEQWKNMDRFSNIPPHILQFELLEKFSKKRFQQIEKMASFHKLNHKLNFSNCNGNTNYDYIIKKYLKEND